MNRHDEANTRFRNFANAPNNAEVNVTLSTQRRHMEEGGGVQIEFHSFLDSALDGDEWSNSPPGHSLPLHILGQWLPGPQNCLDVSEERKIFFISRDETPDCPVRGMFLPR